MSRDKATIDLAILRLASAWRRSPPVRPEWGTALAVVLVLAARYAAPTPGVAAQWALGRRLISENMVEGASTLFEGAVALATAVGLVGSWRLAVWAAYLGLVTAAAMGWALYRSPATRPLVILADGLVVALAASLAGMLAAARWLALAPWGGIRLAARGMGAVVRVVRVIGMKAVAAAVTAAVAIYRLVLHPGLLLFRTLGRAVAAVVRAGRAAGLLLHSFVVRPAMLPLALLGRGLRVGLRWLGAEVSLRLPIAGAFLLPRVLVVPAMPFLLLFLTPIAVVYGVWLAAAWVTTTVWVVLLRPMKRGASLGLRSVGRGMRSACLALAALLRICWAGIRAVVRGGATPVRGLWLGIMTVLHPGLLLFRTLGRAVVAVVRAGRAAGLLLHSFVVRLAMPPLALFGRGLRAGLGWLGGEVSVRLPIAGAFVLPRVLLVPVLPFLLLFLTPIAVVYGVWLAAAWVTRTVWGVLLRPMKRGASIGLRSVGRAMWRACSAVGTLARVYRARIWAVVGAVGAPVLHGLRLGTRAATLGMALVLRAIRAVVVSVGRGSALALVYSLRMLWAAAAAIGRLVALVVGSVAAWWWLALKATASAAAAVFGAAWVAIRSVLLVLGAGLLSLLRLLWVAIRTVGTGLGAILRVCWAGFVAVARAVAGVVALMLAGGVAVARALGRGLRLLATGLARIVVAPMRLLVGGLAAALRTAMGAGLLVLGLGAQGTVASAGALAGGFRLLSRPFVLLAVIAFRRSIFATRLGLGWLRAAAAIVLRSIWLAIWIPMRALWMVLSSLARVLWAGARAIASGLVASMRILADGLRVVSRPLATSGVLLVKALAVVSRMSLRTLLGGLITLQAGGLIALRGLWLVLWIPVRTVGIGGATLARLLWIGALTIGMEAAAASVFVGRSLKGGAAAAIAAAGPAPEFVPRPLWLMVAVVVAIAASPLQLFVRWMPLGLQTSAVAVTGSMAGSPILPAQIRKERGMVSNASLSRESVIGVVALIGVVGGVLWFFFGFIGPQPAPVIVNHWANTYMMDPPMFPAMSKQFNEQVHRTAAGRRIEVHPTLVNSGLIADELISRVLTGMGSGICNQSPGGCQTPDLPTLITPASDHWLPLINHKAGRTVIDRADTTLLATTYNGIAMQRRMANCLGWPDREIGFADLIDLHNNPLGWASCSTAKTDWGKEVLVTYSDPFSSSTGRSVLYALYGIAAGKQPEALTPADVLNPEVLSYIKRFQASVSHYVPDSTVVARKMLEGPRFGQLFFYPENNFVSIKRGRVTVQIPGEAKRRSLDPNLDMVLIYPKEGAPTNRHSAATVHADWVTAEEHEAAQQWAAFLREDAQQRVFVEHGFRPAGNVPWDDVINLRNGVDPRKPTVFMNPDNVDAAAAAIILDSWGEVKKPGVVTFVVDTSGSMAGAKMEQAKKGMIRVLDQLAPSNLVGFVTFSNQVNGRIPVAPLADNRYRIRDSVEAMRPSGETALYDAIIDAIQMTDAAAPDLQAIRGVVVLTDGKANRGRALDRLVAMSVDERPLRQCGGFEGGMDCMDQSGRVVTMDKVLGEGLATSVTHRNMHIFFVGLGDADIQVGRVLASATGSTYVPATEKNIETVLENFGKYF